MLVYFMVIWNILRPFGKVVAIWNILRPFGKVVAIWYILVHCVKKYLATLVHGRCFNAGAYYTQASGRKSRTRLQAEDAAACERGWGDDGGGSMCKQSDNIITWTLFM
jgi:hypothetical protein